MNKKMGITMLIIGGILLLFSIFTFLFISDIQERYECNTKTSLFINTSECRNIGIVNMLGGLSLVPGILLLAVGSYLYRLARGQEKRALEH